MLVTVECDVLASSREHFLEAFDRLSAERRRDGAYDWGIFEDAAGAAGS